MSGGRFLLVMGTRPEVIKLAPVYFALKNAGADVGIYDTGQQSDLLEQAFDVFNLEPTFIHVPSGDYSIHAQLADLLTAISEKLAQYPPDFVIVQGDTTSALAGALSAFYEGIKIAHVEAGLLTGDLSSPFPEEGHRRMISQIADLNFAPTDTAKANLQEIGASNYHVVGNTVVDALEMIPWASSGIEGRYVLVTLHRRESFGDKLRGMLEAVRDLSRKYPDVEFIYSVHPNPKVRDLAFEVLGDSQVTLLDPPAYTSWINLMRGAYFIMTDSGGIQEEAPSFGVPVLVLRDKTERPEAIYRGYSRMAHTRPERILRMASKLLDDESERAKMVAKSNPYGDGKAAQRIAEILMEAVGEQRLLQTV